MKKLIAVLSLSFLLFPLWAKDLTGRVGLGAELINLYQQAGAVGPFAEMVSAISARTYFNENVGLSGVFAMTMNGGDQFGLGAGFLYNFVSETNMNLLTKVGFHLGLADDVTAFNIPVLLNAEFFIERISNLGIEMGVGIMHFDIIEGDLYFKLGTSQLAPALGFHYYF